MGMIWKGTHILIKGPTADNACQSKNQALGSKELSAELRKTEKGLCQATHLGKSSEKKSASLKGHRSIISVTLNGRSLKQPGFFLELASWPN